MAVQGSPIPGGDIYGWRKLDAEKAYQNAIAMLGQRRSGILQQYGYQADYDQETGQSRNVRIDPFSQYGAVQQMLRGQAQQYDAVDEESRARGLGGVGLGAQGMAEARYRGGAQTAQLGQGLVGDLADLAGGQMSAKQARDAAIWQAEWEAAQEAIKDQAFTPADLSDLPGDDPDAPGGAGPGTTPATAAATNKARAAAAARALALRSEAMNQRYGLTTAAGRATAARSSALNAKYNLPKPAPKPKKKKGKK